MLVILKFINFTTTLHLENIPTTLEEHIQQTVQEVVQSLRNYVKHTCVTPDYKGKTTRRLVTMKTTNIVGKATCNPP
jgi:hypothetical protein